jgi:hypothetical protein
MGKIQKLKLNINHLELDQVEKKLNEIIDYINEVEKQPERVEYEKRVRVLGELSGSKKHIEAHKEFLKLPEKQTDDKTEEAIALLKEKGYKIVKS